MKTNYLDDRQVSMPTPCRQNFQKLTKKALNEFIGWTTSRYNDYLGFGSKKSNVNIVFESFKVGYYVQYSERDKSRLVYSFPDKEIFTIKCASPVGERPTNSSGSTRNWKTKQGGDIYIVDCRHKTISAYYSKKTIKFVEYLKQKEEGK